MVKATGHKQTQAAQLVVAAGAGGASSLISCPAELIMIQQQKTGRSLLTEAVSVFQRFVLTDCLCSCARRHDSPRRVSANAKGMAVQPLAAKYTDTAGMPPSRPTLAQVWPVSVCPHPAQPLARLLPANLQITGQLPLHQASG